jgi:hypothetical protein
MGRLNAALVDLEQIDFLPHESIVDAEADPASDPPVDPPTMTALRGPGGFPLLGSALTVDRRNLPAAMAVVLPAVALSGDDDPSEPSLGAGLVVSLATASDDSCPVDVPRAKPRPVRQGTVLSGLNIAATLAFGLLLPDLIGVLQSVAPKRPLPFVLRRRRRPLPDGADSIPASSESLG